MESNTQNSFDSLYRQQVQSLKLQGLSKKTVESYSRAVRRLFEYFDRIPHQLGSDELKQQYRRLS